MPYYRNKGPAKASKQFVNVWLMYLIIVFKNDQIFMISQSICTLSNTEKSHSTDYLMSIGKIHKVCSNDFYSSKLLSECMASFPIKWK